MRRRDIYGLPRAQGVQVAGGVSDENGISDVYRRCDKAVIHASWSE